MEEVIRHRFRPALTGRNAISNVERDLLTLPTRLGGLGIINPSETTTSQYMSSLKIAAPLITIIQQSTEYTHATKHVQHQAVTKAKSDRRQQQSRKAASLARQLPHDLQHGVEIAKEKGASSWLTTLPVEEHGFALHKGAFRDAICLCYGWRPSRLPAECVCGKSFFSGPRPQLQSRWISIIEAQ